MNTQPPALPRLDESTRPTWTFEGTPSGSGLGQRLIEVHNHLREQTRTLLASVADVMSGRAGVDSARSALETLSLRQNYPALGGFCSGYCELLTIHHTLEDQRVFPGLGKAHPALAPVLKQLFAEHEVVAELIERLDTALAAAPTDQGAQDTLGVVSETLASALLSHLAYEEAQLVAVLDASDGAPPTPGAGPRAG